MRQHIIFGFLAFLLSPQRAACQRQYHKQDHDANHYYVIEHDASHGVPLSDITSHLGVSLVDRVGELDNVWLVSTPRDPSDDSTPELITRGDEEEDEVLMEREIAKNDRVLETFRALRSAATSGQTLEARDVSSPTSARSLYSSIAHIEKQIPRELSPRAPIPPPDLDRRAPIRHPGVNDVIRKFDLEDPYFSLQWHLVNERYPDNMMNVTPVWEMGYQGKGILTTLIDDGLDYTAADLKENFDAENSYDFIDHTKLPFPKESYHHHGTRCAGQIAGGLNTFCGTGLAPLSHVAGIRILGGKLTTVDQAAAVNHGYQNAHIYSCSWGPRDDGKRMQAPRYIVQRAFWNGVHKGRGGKGNLYVFASGNGGMEEDQCNFDGYTNGIWSVTVGSVDWKGLHPGYSEVCTANLVVGFSSGSGEYIVTTDIGKNECALGHGGTSAAAPNVAGVFALALEARPELTWRDVQHLAIFTSRHVNPSDKTWEILTPSGRPYSPRYGYGAVDASLYVQAAKEWKLVGPQAWLDCGAVQIEGGMMDEEDEFIGGRKIGTGGAESTITVTQAMAEAANLQWKTNRHNAPNDKGVWNGNGPDGKWAGSWESVGGLEHVTVQVWIDHTRRGDVEVELISPNGVKSVLARRRHNDEARTGFPGWTFMSVAHWGENPLGEWKLRVTDQETEVDEGYFVGWNLILWGSAIDPSKAKQYELRPDLGKPLPPDREGTITPVRPEPPEPVSNTTSVTHSAGVPPAKHTDIPSGGNKDTTKNPPLAPPPPDASSNDNKDDKSKDWVGKLKDKASKQTWLGGIIIFIIALNIGIGLYFCFSKRGCCRKRESKGAGVNGPYTPLPGDDGEGLPMAGINGAGGPLGERYVDAPEPERAEEGRGIVLSHQQ